MAETRWSTAHRFEVIHVCSTDPKRWSLGTVSTVTRYTTSFNGLLTDRSLLAEVHGRTGEGVAVEGGPTGLRIEGDRREVFRWTFESTGSNGSRSSDMLLVRVRTWA